MVSKRRRTESQTPEEIDQEQRAHGYQLHKFLLALYAEQKLTARDFAVLNHLCWKAGVRGADWSLYAVPDGRQSGAYQEPICIISFPGEKKVSKIFAAVKPQGFPKHFSLPDPPPRKCRTYGQPACKRLLPEAFGQSLTPRALPRIRGGPRCRSQTCLPYNKAHPCPSPHMRQSRRRSRTHLGSGT